MKEAFLQSIDINDLASEFRVVAEIIGLDNARLLMEHFPGTWIYVPTAQRLRNVTRRYIAQHYRRTGDDGPQDNAREIALALGMSVAFIRRCAREACGDAGGPPAR